MAQLIFQLMGNKILQQWEYHLLTEIIYFALQRPCIEWTQLPRFYAVEKQLLKLQRMFFSIKTISMTVIGNEYKDVKVLKKKKIYLPRSQEANIMS